MKPKKIILIRHGESEGNKNEEIYREVPDYKIPLTEKGKKQAQDAGIKLRELTGNSKTLFYVSPYLRSTQTLEEILKAYETGCDWRVFQEPRLREQDFGNFQDSLKMRNIKNERDHYGRFFYRFPNGESGADVYDRISTFLETLHRVFRRFDDLENIIIVSHGLTIRTFFMRWFHWSVEKFETIANPNNCEYYVMQRASGERYHLTTELKTFPKEHFEVCFLIIFF
eukprot:TRINITY_DN7599_c0_g1_i2.p1 TRINITY_DN7599_c0_g1~~TRINITY_DN7599_c0_g1_i2.p1  ORF type:complete len:226 (+),score=33.63 TRINITY_DN7599_c0_g1_i2:14-691(+)